MGWLKIPIGIDGTLQSGKKTNVLSMDGYLKSNLDFVPKLLKMKYDCVCIVSGHGKVRSGKSTMAIGTVGGYLAWRLAGGKFRCHQTRENGKYEWVIEHIVKPKKKIHFDLHENVAFNPDQLQDRAFELYKKYGNNQILIYDEAKQGTDSARAMESINKGMEDFFLKCGYMGHVIILVLPNYFKLHEDYAVARSWFLIDVFTKRLQRGYFKFYNEEQKEKLFFFGKKRIGIRAKYSAASENFWGKFSSWFPFDREEYDKLKEDDALRSRKQKVQQKFRKQRDSCFYMLQKNADMSSTDIASELSALSGTKIGDRQVRFGIQRISKQGVEEID